MFQYAYHISLLVGKKDQILLSDYHVHTLDTVYDFRIWFFDANLPSLLSVVFQLHCWLLWFCSLFKSYFPSCFGYSIIFNKYTFMGNLMCSSLLTHCLYTRTLHLFYHASLRCWIMLSSTGVGFACCHLTLSTQKPASPPVPEFFMLTLPLVL